MKLNWWGVSAYLWTDFLIWACFKLAYPLLDIPSPADFGIDLIVLYGVQKTFPMKWRPMVRRKAC